VKMFLLQYQKAYNGKEVLRMHLGQMSKIRRQVNNVRCSFSVTTASLAAERSTPFTQV
jgi:hypothetical protein